MSRQDAPTIHLSYHDGEHYNSVRMASDMGSGPPKPIAVQERAASAKDWSSIRPAQVELVIFHPIIPLWSTAFPALQAALFVALNSTC